MGKSMKRRLRYEWFRDWLNAGEFAPILTFLKSAEGSRMNDWLVRKLNEIFDEYLWEVARKNIQFSPDNLQLLSLSRGILLIRLSEIEKMRAHQIRMKLRRHVTGRRPLSQLVKIPFTFVIRIQNRQQEIYSGTALSYYREVLNHTMSLGAARRLHTLQLDYFNRLPVGENWLRKSLAKLESIDVDKSPGGKPDVFLERKETYEQRSVSSEPIALEPVVDDECLPRVLS